MAITRLAQSNPAANTETLLHTSTRNAVVSIIASNISSAASDVSMWTVTSGAGSANYVYHSYNSPIPGNNTLETFRFAIENGDNLYVESSTSFVSFSLNAIFESNGTSNITVASLSASPTSSVIGDVWVNTDDDTINFWDGTEFITAGGAGGSTVAYQSSSPTSPEIGTLWIDSDDNTSILNADAFALATPYQSASPGYDITGQLWVDSDTDTLYVYEGSTWVSLSDIKGGGSDRIFIENDKIVTQNYAITSGKNAISGGPIEIASGVEVEIPSGSNWSIV